MQTESKHRAHILLAIWGRKFINDFLHLSLPSLLAPGNIPALAATYKTRFIFLTRSYDISTFENNPCFQKLKTICDIEFIAIDDLVVFGNYSATLTLAFDRAIRNTGTAMLNTYFLFLTADYVMADGSLLGLIRYIKKGYSGICAGNFQVTREEIQPFLLQQLKCDSKVIQIPPRTLVKECLRHLHPITTASTLNQNLVHNYRANRFFLSHDAEVFAGRFYLLHPLCIKPETMDYRVGSSCDYSFIPELCPSGNIAIINDSDDYCVVEAQSNSHEIDFLNWGGYEIKKLAHALGEWTTKQHRENAKVTIYFHSRELSQQDKDTIEDRFNTFIHHISIELESYPVQPHDGHPYWVGQIQSLEKQRSFLRGNPNTSMSLMELFYSDTTLKKMYYRIFGVPPKVYPWHYRFKEYRALRNNIQSEISSNPANTLVLYDSYQMDYLRYLSWLKQTLKVSQQYHVDHLSALPQEVQFETCIIFLNLENLKNIRTLLATAKAVLARDGKILLVMNNENNEARAYYHFCEHFTQKVSYLTGLGFRIEHVNTLHNQLSRVGAVGIKRINARLAHHQRLRFLCYLYLGLPFTLFSLIRNCLPSFLNQNNSHCTNILVTLTQQTELGR